MTSSKQYKYGLMQQTPLLISSLIEYAGVYHHDVEVVSRLPEHANQPGYVVHRTTYGTLRKRAKQLANVLINKYNIGPGDVVATFASNSYRHLELYYAVSGIGAVLHTLNPRLFAHQVEYIMNHAEDTLVFVDHAFLPAFIEIWKTCKLETCKRVCILSDQEYMPKSGVASTWDCYEIEMSKQKQEFEWPIFSEDVASSLCYTSGTTGNPKGVLYSHRSTVLHSFAACHTDGLGLSTVDSALVLVPLFHANAWGIPYAACMSGSKLVFPGVSVEGPALYELITREKVTFTGGVPTVWLGLLDYLDRNPSLPKPNTLQRLVCGGSSAPPSMIKRFKDEFDVEILHMWGMTEISPLGTTGKLLCKHRQLPFQQQLDHYKRKQGRFVYGVEAQIRDENGKILPFNAKDAGDLYVRGPWIAGGYYKIGSNVDDKQWMQTGDVCTICPDGYMGITDRSKDVIKSGGEWISSIDLENAAVGCPGVMEAAVIGVTHPKWQERPLLVIVRKAGAKVTENEVLEYLKPRVAKWWLPDGVEFVEAIPHTATGKISKLTLRKQFEKYQFKLPSNL